VFYNEMIGRSVVEVVVAKEDIDSKENEEEERRCRRC